MKPIFYMTVGLPGSGKTTWANEQKKENPDTIICNSDDIREELFGSAGDDINTKENNSIVFETLHKRIKKFLSDGYDVIYDATNINSKRRSQFLQEINNIPCYKQCVIFATDYDRCLSNNRLRDRFVPPTVIHNMLIHWETPYYFEGWDEILIIYPREDEPVADILSELSNYYDYDQNNHHHTKTLGIHCFDVGCHFTNAELYKRGIKGWKQKAFRQAGWLHDIGKPLVRYYVQPLPCGSDVKDNAHYYNHENVGAYISLFFKLHDALLTSVLINLHMKPYSWVEEKTKEKYRKLWGDELFDMVMMLHEADEAAH